MSNHRGKGFKLVPTHDSDESPQQSIEGANPSSSRKSLTSMVAKLTPSPPPNFGSNAQGDASHSDFMFCGPCVPCQEPESTETGASSRSGMLSANGYGLLATRFQVRNSALPVSERGTIQSLLKALPGVSNVFVDVDQQCITIDHDTSMRNVHVLNKLEATGYTAFVADTISSSNNQEHVVRSKFYVHGICCSTEVPTVRGILKQIPGVSRQQINITTKMVQVQHDTSIISAQRIAERLSKEGFPTKVQRDGIAQAGPPNGHRRHGQTTLAVRGNLSSEDRPFIEQKLGELEAVVRICFNIAEGLVHVDHDVYELTSIQLVKHMEPQFDCDVVAAGEEAIGNDIARILDRIRRSNFVESTVSVEKLNSSLLKELEDVLFRSFGRHEVRAVYPNIISQTMKIEHDPNVVSVDHLIERMTHCGCKATVIVDGAMLNLYLPEEVGDSKSQQTLDQDEASFITVHLNVWLSGVFWVLSMLSYREQLDDFKYFGLASVVFGLPPICVKAWRTLRRCQFDANCMMVTAALGALSLQQYDEAGSVAFLFSVSEYLEVRATTKARNALMSICDLRPDHANVIHPVTKEIVVVPAERVPIGALVSVRTGDKIVADGIITEGSSSLDESSLTGESMPIQKKKGDSVKGGTINIGRTQLVIRTATNVENSAVSRLIRLVEDAQSNRSPTEKLIDSFARSYTPSVMFVAGLMCTIPWLSGVENGRHWMLNGLIIVVIACPCSLTISTPVTYAAGLGASAHKGIIIKGGAKLEALGSVDKIVFDKTGTLTKGKFSVVHLEVIGTTKSRQEVLELLALVQERSSHPVATCLVRAAKHEGVTIPRHRTLSNHTILKGEGISADVDGEPVFIGNQRLFERLGSFNLLGLKHKNLARNWSATGSMVGFIGTMNGGIFGIFCVKDAIREEARSVIQGFQNACIDTMICTGDSDSVAQAVAREVGVPPAWVHSQLLPEDKLHFVGSLRRAQPQNYALCREKRYVLFCGDGVNDAPALAVSDIGCSMGEGAAMAMEMSDITLMDSNLTKLSFAVNMGQRVLRTVKENILISLVGKLAVIGLTFTGKMTLLLAIASDVGVMLFVTINGMKLLAAWEPTYPKTPIATALRFQDKTPSNNHMDCSSKTIELALISDSEVV